MTENTSLINKFQLTLKRSCETDHNITLLKSSTLQCSFIIIIIFIYLFIF